MIVVLQISSRLPACSPTPVPENTSHSSFCTFTDPYTYTALSNLAPSYLTDLLRCHSPSCHLRSSAANLLTPSPDPKPLPLPPQLLNSPLSLTSTSLTYFTHSRTNLVTFSTLHAEVNYTPFEFLISLSIFSSPAHYVKRFF